MIGSILVATREFSSGLEALGHGEQSFGTAL